MPYSTPPWSKSGQLVELRAIRAITGNYWQLCSINPCLLIYSLAAVEPLCRVVVGSASSRTSPRSATEMKAECRQTRFCEKDVGQTSTFKVQNFNDIHCHKTFIEIYFWRDCRQGRWSLSHSRHCRWRWRRIQAMEVRQYSPSSIIFLFATVNSYLSNWIGHRQQKRQNGAENPWKTLQKWIRESKKERKKCLQTSRYKLPKWVTGSWPSRPILAAVQFYDHTCHATCPYVKLHIQRFNASYNDTHVVLSASVHS